MTDRDQGSLLDRDVTTTGRANPATSHAAAAGALPRTGSKRRQIVEWIATRQGRDGGPGATDDEIERHFGWTHQSASACRNGLMNDGLVTNSGYTRQVEHSGNLAIIWTLTAHAYDLLRQA